MDRGAWQATVYGVARVGLDLETKLLLLLTHLVVLKLFMLGNITLIRPER